MKTVFDILIAVLAVFGGYSALKLLSEKIFIPQRFAPIAAIRLDGSEDDELIDILIDEARASWQRRPRVTVLIPEGDGEIAARVHRLCPSADRVEVSRND